jgi:PAS domain S-box-containing protein
MNKAAHASPPRRRDRLETPEIQALLDLLPQAALLVDLRSRQISLANAKATELSAYTRAELTAARLNDIFPTLRNKDFPWSHAEPACDLLLARHSGLTLWVQASAHWLHDPTSQRVVLTLEPITTRRQALAEKQRQQQLWEALNYLAQTPSLPDQDTALSLALQAGSLITGAPILALYQADSQALVLHRTAGIGPTERLPEHIPPSDLAALKTAHLWTYRRRTPTTLHRAARSEQLSFVASAPLGQSNALIGLAAAAGVEGEPAEAILPALQTVAETLTTIIQNHLLTARIQQAGREQNQALKLGSAIQDAVQDGIILLSPDWLIIEMNPAAELMLGYAGPEVGGQPLENILVSDKNLIPAMAIARQMGYAHDLGNVSLYRRNGQAFLAQLRSLALMIDGQLVYWVVLIRDLSLEEQFRLRTQQLEQRALLGEVTAVFAHEVRNPINNISTGLQLMALNLPAGDPNHATIDRLQQDCDRLAELMKSVLAFARPKEYRFEPTPIDPLLRRLLERWHPRLARHGVTEFLQVEPDTPPVMADPRALEQVFTNLMANAVQAMAHGGGRLALKARPAVLNGTNHPGVEISVSDTGTGIPEEMRERIFEPFFTASPGGTGLGLAITKQIITAHRGAIRVASIPGGTVFQVLLPAARADPRPTPETFSEAP